MYSGTTSQNEKVTFEVLPGGTSLRNFRLSDVNLSCQPPDLISLHAPGTTLAQTPVPIKPDGTFVIELSESGLLEGSRFTDNVTAKGSFVGSQALGKFEEKFTVDLGFFVITCTAPNVTWNASLLP